MRENSQLCTSGFVQLFLIAVIRILSIVDTSASSSWHDQRARMQVHESQGAKQVTFQLQGCSVQLSAPRTQPPGSGDDSAAGAEPAEAPQGRVEIVRHSSQLDAQDLALLARVMQLSNDTSLKPLPPDVRPHPLLAHATVLGTADRPSDRHLRCVKQ